MRANVVVGDPNPCGGSERVLLVTMQALLDMGIDFDLTTLRCPDLSKLENAYGANLISPMNKIKKINVVNIIEVLRQHRELEDGQHRERDSRDYCQRDYDLTINTQGNWVPYYHSYFTRYNAITYCHFPSVKYHIESENTSYLEKDLGIKVLSHINNNNDNNNDDDDYAVSDTTKANESACDSLKSKKEWFNILKYAYWNLMRNSTIVTNSEFSRRAIFEAFGIGQIYVLSPPIDIDTFHNVALVPAYDENNDDDSADSDYRAKYNDDDRFILVISRIDPCKQIENAIKLARILKSKNIGKGMIIVGNLYHRHFDYYFYLKQLILDLNLADYVSFLINASLDKLLCAMRQSKIYFHPMIGEHFGMSIAEAMAAGLIPIVPSIGGQTEFVPQQYHYSTLEQAAEIISSAFRLPYTERILISNSVNKFSNSNYIEGFQQIVSKVLSSLSHNKKFSNHT
jgi:glycosyltransferase involved in cell wall biosynthesis